MGLQQGCLSCLVVSVYTVEEGLRPTSLIGFEVSPEMSSLLVVCKCNYIFNSVVSCIIDDALMQTLIFRMERNGKRCIFPMVKQDGQ